MQSPPWSVTEKRHGSVGEPLAMSADEIVNVLDVPVPVKLYAYQRIYGLLHRSPKTLNHLKVQNLDDDSNTFSNKLNELDVPDHIKFSFVYILLISCNSSFRYSDTLTSLVCCAVIPNLSKALT